MSKHFTRITAWAQAHQNREEGQGVVEYGLVVGLVSIIIIVALATGASGWISSLVADVTAGI